MKLGKLSAPRCTQISSDALRANSIIEKAIVKLVDDIDRYQRQLDTPTISNSEQVVQQTSKVLGLIIYFLANAKAFLLENKVKRGAKAAFSQRLERILREIDGEDQTLRYEVELADRRGQHCHA